MPRLGDIHEQTNLLKEYILRESEFKVAQRILSTYKESHKIKFLLSFPKQLTSRDIFLCAYRFLSKSLGEEQRKFLSIFIM